jgi:hypothetical protein
MALFHIIPAWRNAERLVSAESPEDRAAVAASIEAYAESQARDDPADAGTSVTGGAGSPFH